MSATTTVLTDWNIDSYKTDYESDEHWDLRKRFMTLHKDKFPEDELVCLAQVFTNVEFMGCKYPDETMMLVAQLSGDVASEFRKERAGRLKRTFVRASDAAEARAKGRRTENNKECNTFHITTVLSQTKISNYDSMDDDEEDNLNNSRPCFQGVTNNSSSNNHKKTHSFGFQISDNYYKPLTLSNNTDSSPFNQFPAFGTFNNTTIGYFNADLDKPIELFDKSLPYGHYILYLTNDRNSVYTSGIKCNIPVTEKQTLLNEKQVQGELFVNGKVAGTVIATSVKEAKSYAYDAALKRLCRECYVIKPNPDPDRINISKNNETVVANVIRKAEPKLDASNIGYKMMLKLGWTGGGLGLNTQGRENPIDFFVKQNRKGLGNNSNEINSNYFRTLLKNYIQSDDIRDLYFESCFTKDERATLHQIAATKKLRSASNGKGHSRHLVISKKNITPAQIVQEVLVHRNPIYINKYEVKVPKSKAADFPGNVKFKSEITSEIHQFNTK